MRKENHTSLKFKYLGPTNTKNARIKIIQTNNKKFTSLDLPQDLTVLEFCENILSKLDLQFFFLIVDNTQTNSYQFVIKSNFDYFVDHVQGIKDKFKG